VGLTSVRQGTEACSEPWGPEDEPGAVALAALEVLGHQSTGSHSTEAGMHTRGSFVAEESMAEEVARTLRTGMRDQKKEKQDRGWRIEQADLPERNCSELAVALTTLEAGTAPTQARNHTAVRIRA